MDVENTFRICVLGDTGVGKTALVNQFLTSEHMNTYDSSLGNNIFYNSVEKLEFFFRLIYMKSIFMSLEPLKLPL